MNKSNANIECITSYLQYSEIPRAKDMESYLPNNVRCVENLKLF